MSMIIGVISVVVDTAFMLYIWRHLLSVHVPKNIQETWAYWCVDAIFFCHIVVVCWTL